MKKFLLLLSFVCFAFLALAAGEGNYAIVKGKVYFSDHARVLLNRIRMETDDGLTLVVPLKEVDAYKVEDRIYHRLPLVCLNGEERGDALLQLVAHRNGLSLYRCAKPDETLGCSFEDNTGYVSMYFVYKDNNLYLRVDERNGWTVFPFFGIQTMSNRNEL